MQFRGILQATCCRESVVFGVFHQGNLVILPPHPILSVLTKSRFRTHDFRSPDGRESPPYFELDGTNHNRAPLYFNSRRQKSANNESTCSFIVCLTIEICLQSQNVFSIKDLNRYNFSFPNLFEFNSKSDWISVFVTFFRSHTKTKQRCGVSNYWCFPSVFLSQSQGTLQKVGTRNRAVVKYLLEPVQKDDN